MLCNVMYVKGKDSVDIVIQTNLPLKPSITIIDNIKWILDICQPLFTISFFSRSDMSKWQNDIRTFSIVDNFCNFLHQKDVSFSVYSMSFELVYYL